jgi:hypothetical protein
MGSGCPSFLRQYSENSSLVDGRAIFAPLYTCSGCIYGIRK